MAETKPEDERRVLNQYLAQTLAQNQSLKAELEQKNKILAQQNNDTSQEILELKQANELLVEELNQMRERCANLKKQECLLALSSSAGKEQSRSSSSRMTLNTSIKLTESIGLPHTCSATHKLAEAEKQIKILTDYIHLKGKEVQQQQSHHNQGSIVNLSNQSGICGGACQEKIRNLQRQKKKLELNIEKCKKVVAESENYYLGEIQKIRDDSALLEQRLRIVQNQKESAVRDLQDSQNHFQTIANQYQQKVREAEVAHVFLSQNLEKKYEDFIDNLKSQYDRKISVLEEQLNLAKGLIEQNNPGIADFKSYTPARFAMAESKMILSEKSPADSFRFTAGSFSSSIKEELSRKSRQDDLAKSVLSINSRTPIKASRSPYSHMFADRTNNL